MANPFVFGGASFPYEDMAFHSQPYLGIEDSLVDSNIPYIDPTLQSPSPTPYGIAWTAPAQRHPKQPSTTTLFPSDLPTQIANHTPIRPALGIHPVPPPSQIRLASPISSIEPSSGNALSPPADTESHYDNFPRTPSDTALLSPFQQPLPLEPVAHAVQFRSMGPDYVNPFDVNPSQQIDHGDSDNGIIDFSFPQQGFTFDIHVGCEAHAVHGSSATGFNARKASPKQTALATRMVPETLSQYPSPPTADGMESDDEISPKRQLDDDADEDYQPSKRQRTGTRTTRRAPKTAETTASSAPRRTRNRGNNLPSARSLTSTNRAKNPFRCTACKEATDFACQADLDSHVKKQHIRSFNCVFDFAGCESTFGSKNEWKRHVATQHLLLHYWICTEGACTATQSSGSQSTHTHHHQKPNGAIFNRKDLFTQHLKRMHAPPELKDHLPPSKVSRSSTSTQSQDTTGKCNKALLSQWTARVKRLQEAAIRPRCHLPTFMRCPVPGCPAPPFKGQDAWNQRMEHVAKHMESAAEGQEGRVVFGGVGDDTLVEWAAREEVGIIVPSSRVEGRKWVLKRPLKRGPGGNVVITVPVTGVGAKQQQEAEEEEEGVEGEIVVYSPLEGGEEGDEVDAEGEADD